MKYGLLLVISLISAISSSAQGTIRLTVDWNPQAARYEVFALSASTQRNFAFGKTQIAVVVPKSSPDTRLNVISHAGGSWTDEKFITDPASSPGRDFHAVASGGSIVHFTANQKLLLFSFTFADSQCRDGVRLFNNGADPGASAQGFNGIDFSNSILGGGNVQIYQSNISNSGTVCMDCPVEFTVPKLKKQS
ncbi:MAG: hypothetical protein LRY55_12025 [Leadbetterella sp.]|nr:hypothetical protein [Leadbetterella sp.]